MQTPKGTLERSQAIGLYSSHFQIKEKKLVIDLILKKKSLGRIRIKANKRHVESLSVNDLL